MADGGSPFGEDWRNALQAHYKDVVRQGDRITEESLAHLLYDVGYDADDLRRWKLEATMRAEDLAGDFVPSLDIPEATVHPGVDVQPEADLEVESEPEVEITPTLDELEQAASTITDNDETIVDEVSDESDDPPPSDAPQQMSLF